MSDDAMTDEERDAEAERAYEQHYKPGVTDPAATSGPGYRALPIAACPECLGDCVYEGADGWRCPACQRTWTYQEVAYFEGDDPRD